MAVAWARRWRRLIQNGNTRFQLYSQIQSHTYTPQHCLTIFVVFLRFIAARVCDYFIILIIVGSTRGKIKKYSYI